MMPFDHIIFNNVPQEYGKSDDCVDHDQFQFKLNPGIRIQKRKRRKMP
jgi:hypothetical protein